MYVPGGNREVAEASAVFYAVLELCGLPVQKDLSRYSVRPTDGGDYIVNIELERTVSDPDYRPSVDLSGMWVCGDMLAEVGKVSGFVLVCAFPLHIANRRLGEQPNGRLRISVRVYHRRHHR